MVTSGTPSEVKIPETTHKNHNVLDHPGKGCCPSRALREVMSKEVQTQQVALDKNSELVAFASSG